MKLLKVELVDNKGDIGNMFWVNPEKVVGVISVLIPGDLTGPTGEPIPRERAGIDLGTKVVLVNESPERIVELLLEIV